MERERLKNIALRKVKQEQKTKPVAKRIKCGNDSFVFDFRWPVTTKTCKNNQCRAVDIVSHV